MAITIKFKGLRIDSVTLRLDGVSEKEARLLAAFDEMVKVEEEPKPTAEAAPVPTIAAPPSQQTSLYTLYEEYESGCHRLGTEPLDPAHWRALGCPEPEVEVPDFKEYQWGAIFTAHEADHRAGVKRSPQEMLDIGHRALTPEQIVEKWRLVRMAAAGNKDACEQLKQEADLAQ